MTTTAIQNSCVAGAMAGLMAGRFSGSFTPIDYIAIANAARAIADEFITENTASGSPISDSDNPQIGELVQAITTATIINSGAVSIIPADYLGYGKQIYAASKQGLTELVVINQFLAGTMTLASRTGTGVPFPEYKALLGGYVQLPEPQWNTCKFELTLFSNNTVTWCDERHIGTHTVLANGTYTLDNLGNFTASISYGAYTISITGVLTGTNLVATTTTNVRGVQEVYNIPSTTTTSTLTFIDGTYYSNFGNDVNDGTSLKTSKETLPVSPGGITDGDVIYLERGSIFTSGYIGAVDKVFSLKGVGIGYRPVGNAFEVVTVWHSEGGNAWSATVTGDQPVNPAVPGVPTAIENGLFLQQVADLATCQATPGSYTYTGNFTPGGSTATVYIHTTDSSNPNTNSKTYEVATQEGFACGEGASQFDSLHGRGSSEQSGPIITRDFDKNGGDNAGVVKNCIATHGRKHNLGIAGGEITDCVSMFCQSENTTAGLNHIVIYRVGSDVVRVNFTLNNCVMLSQPNLPVYFDNALLLEVQIGTVGVGNVLVDKMYSAYLGDGGAAGAGASLGSCAFSVTIVTDYANSFIWNDCISERTKALNMFQSVPMTFQINRLRQYELETLNINQFLVSGCNDVTINNSLSVTGSPISGEAQGQVYLLAGTTPITYKQTNSTIIRLGTPAFSATIGIDTAASANVTWQVDSCMMVGHGLGVTAYDDGTNVSTRITGDHNTWTSPQVNGFFWKSGGKQWSEYQSGGGIWPASDANSQCGVSPTFSGTSGRYPSYVQTSSFPGGYNPTSMIPVEEYLGRLFLDAMQLTGIYPP